MPARAILHALDAPPGARILDYGTGTGRYAIYVATERPDTTVTAFDVQERMLETARERAAERGLANLAVAGPDPTSLPAGAFDRILAINVLHEIGDQDLRAWPALLAPDGFVLVVDWDAAVEREIGPPPDHAHSTSEALARLRQCGLRAQALHTGEFPYHYVLRATPAQPAGGLT